jgi:hypothetical protein
MDVHFTVGVGSAAARRRGSFRFARRGSSVPPEHTKRAAGARADGAAVRVETLESRTLLSAQLVSDVATPGTLRLEMVTVGHGGE